MIDKKHNFEEGSLNFWIPANTFNYNDNKIHILINYGDSSGSIFIIKDLDNKLKFSHVIANKGRTDVEIDVKDLSINDRHMVTATWSLNLKEINLYLDGNKKHNKTDIIN